MMVGDATRVELGCIVRDSSHHTAPITTSHSLIQGVSDSHFELDRSTVKMSWLERLKC
jgi:hypothetical protein